jgi:excisionase family DNA binding protein
MGEETLTPEEAARYLRVNTQTVYRALRRGRLPGGKVGRQWRIPKAALDRFIEGVKTRDQSKG